MKINKIAATVACVALSHISWAAGSKDLGDSLTPMGSEKAGNSDGSIPAWTGGDGALPGWAFGKSRLDFFAYKSDKPLFTIDASNVDKYAAQLTPGQIAVLKTVKGYRMPVYPTRRTCSSPAFVNEATKKNASGAAALDANGRSLKTALLPGIPFPLPKSGVEVIWNFKLRYRGVGNEIANGKTFVSPRQGAAEWIEAGWSQVQYFPWGGRQSKPSTEMPPVELQQISSYSLPPALAGQALLAYKVPKHMRFVEALPKSTVGKILRRDLRGLA